MPSLKHIHTYAQYKGRKGYFKCIHPECTHFTSRELVLEKKSCCTSCGGEFILDYENTQMVRPRCLMCRDTKKAKAFQIGKRLLAKEISFTVGEGLIEKGEQE